jgi:hypothetical protein
MSTLTQFFGSSGGVPSNAIPIELLVVAGGGGSGLSNDKGCGGGGAGRVVYIQGLYVVPSVSYTITIGGGGAAGATGSSSSFGSLILAPGGGGASVAAAGLSGGSGAGGTHNSTLYASGGTVPGRLAFYNNIAVSDKIYADSTTVIQDLGYVGGNPVSNSGGGGGGAGGPGGSAIYAGGPTTNLANQGGPGVILSITGSETKYAFGGEGGSINGPSFQIRPDSGYGRDAGAANSGSGGGASVSGNYAGGSGVVVVAYSSSYNAATTTGSPTTPTRTGFRVYGFTGSGSITFA